MDFLSNLASGFIGLFQAGGQQFLAYLFTIDAETGEVSLGIIPTLVCLITFVNAIIALIGQDRMNGFARFCSRYRLLRYTILPVLALFLLANPMCYTMGQFLEERFKPAFYDATVSFCHPITGLFPHANAGEYFVYGGIAAGITDLGLDLGGLAVRYFLVGLIVIFIRGMACEFLTVRFLKRGEHANG